jgi:AcrR family transcriptional regulator
MTKRQEEIITASITLISEKGIQGLTIKNLSKRIGISEPAIYRHFESKTDILLTLLENFKIVVSQSIREVDKLDTSSWSKIHTLIKKFYGMFAESPSLVAVIFAEEIFKNETMLSEKIIEILNINEKALLKFITKGQKSGELRNDINKKYIALIIIGSMRMLVKKWEMNGFKFNINSEGENLFIELEKLIKKV